MKSYQYWRRLTALTLTGLACACLMHAVALAADAGVHVDQVGYLTDYPKLAMVNDDGGTEFSIVDANTKK